MIRTVRTSQTVWPSAEGLDKFSSEGEGKRFDEFALVFDKNSPMMSGQRGHHILMFQLPANGVLSAVKLDAAMGSDLANPGDQATCNGQRQPALAVEIGIESEACRQVTESRLESIPENAREARPVFVRRETPAGLPEVIIIQETPAGSAQGSEIGAAMSKNPSLPCVIEALDGRVSTGLSRRNEEKMNAQEEMEADDLREAVAIPPSSRRGHLVVHLGGPGQPHKTPGIKEMSEQRERSLVPELMGRNRLAGDIDGVEGIEPGDTARASQMAGADQVGLLEVSHFPGSDVGIWRSARRLSGLDLFGSPGPGQDLLDRRDGGEATNALLIELMMDGLGADAGESRPAGLVGRQFISKIQDFLDDRHFRPVPDMLRDPTSVPKPVQTEGCITADPLGQPEASSLDFVENLLETDAFTEKPNRPAPPFIFEVAFHRPALLPFGMGKSLGDAKSVCDVLTVY